MNKFYKLPIVLQWIIALVLAGFVLYVMNLWFDLPKNNITYYISIFFLVPLFQFCFTPIFTLLKIYQYLTPMMLVYGANDKKYDLHNGTTFDYLFVMRNVKPGIKWRQKILLNFVQGFLEIIRRIENEELPETVVVRGSSYFFSENTAKRMGFEISRTGFGEKLNLFVSYLDLMLVYSLAYGKFRFPNLNNIKTATTTGKQLLIQKDKLQRLERHLS